MGVKSVRVESLSASLDSCVPCLVVSLKVLLVKGLYYRLSSHLDIVGRSMLIRLEILFIGTVFPLIVPLLKVIWWWCKVRRKVLLLTLVLKKSIEVMTHITCEMIWIHCLLHDMVSSSTNQWLYIVNQASIYIVHDHIFSWYLSWLLVSHFLSNVVMQLRIVKFFCYIYLSTWWYLY